MPQKDMQQSDTDPADLRRRVKHNMSNGVQSAGKCWQLKFVLKPGHGTPPDSPHFTAPAKGGKAFLRELPFAEKASVP
jgi:hypothetical protein